TAEWDIRNLPQVQCIRSYKAQEDDELTLEKADILQAKTITNDGWIEGIRLSDGEKGWFPKSYVEEITSRSARLRNLRENNRINLDAPSRTSCSGKRNLPRSLCWPVRSSPD
uniref:Rho guanine nucleotide exchange factor 19 n=1 Tax=Erpetoichthys calabaricus TaxID=27687 RepID=A0A8C4SHK7_ERPCA